MCFNSMRFNAFFIYTPVHAEPSACRVTPEAREKARSGQCSPDTYAVEDGEVGTNLPNARFRAWAGLPLACKYLAQSFAVASV